MKINKNNYEAFFVDYLEGNLDESMVDEFIEFIQKNPDLKKEMELFNSVSLEPENLKFSKKAGLYKDKFDAEDAFNQAAIAKLEGDLKGDEKADFEEYLSKHPEKQKEAALFAHTKLQPDESIKFRKKSRVYHRPASRTILLWSGRVAALLVLALSVYLFTDNNPEITPENQVAVIEENSKQDQKTSTPEETDENNLESGTAGDNKDLIQKPAAVEEKQEKTDTKPDEIVKVQPDNKLLAESSPEETVTEQVATGRTPIEIPSKINTLSAKVKTQKPQGLLASVDQYTEQIPEAEINEDERLIGDVVREKTGLDDISLNKITKAGLKLVSSISKDNFTYETNSSGEITEVNFDSRLLAFSIPTNNGE